jgi:hypothetical protein
VPHSPYRPAAAKRAECDKLTKYVGTLKFNPELFLPKLTRLPKLNLADYSDPDVSTLAQRVQQRVIETREVIDRYGTNLKTHWRMELLQEIFKELALPVFAFAFGLGLARRTIDLVRDLPLRFRIQRIDRIARRRLRRGRRCIGAFLSRRSGFCRIGGLAARPAHALDRRRQHTDTGHRADAPATAASDLNGTLTKSE